MSWVKIDDSFYDHPKVVAAGPLAVALHVCALSYSARHLTDGRIARALVPFLARFDGIALIDSGRSRGPTLPVDVYALAEQLVQVGLWEHDGEGYLIHDFLEYNPSRDEVLELRGKRAEAGRRGGLRRRKGRAGEANSEANASAPASPGLQTMSEAKAKQSRTPYPTPSPGTFLFEGAAAPEVVDDQASGASEIVAAYAAGRRAKGHPPCDAPGRSILGQHAKAYLEGPSDPRITSAPWYDAERERTRRLEVAVRAATRAGEQGRNPAFLGEWLVRQQNVTAREHHADHGRGRSAADRGLRPLAEAM